MVALATDHDGNHDFDNHNLCAITIHDGSFRRTWRRRLGNAPPSVKVLIFLQEGAVRHFLFAVSLGGRVSQTHVLRGCTGVAYKRPLACFLLMCYTAELLQLYISTPPPSPYPSANPFVDARVTQQHYLILQHNFKMSSRKTNSQHCSVQKSAQWHTVFRYRYRKI